MEQSGIRQAGITRVVIVVAVLWTGLALAAAGTAQGQAQGPCADDAAKFCGDVQPGGGRIMKCMKEHENELSPACKERVAELKKGFQEFREACQDDALKFCQEGITRGGGRIVKCLKDHENELSPECKARMERGRMQNK